MITIGGTNYRRDGSQWVRHLGDYWNEACENNASAMLDEIERLQAIVAALPTRDGDGTLWPSYVPPPGVKAWCIWRQDDREVWRVSRCAIADEAESIYELEVFDAEDECEVGLLFDTKEAAEKALKEAGE